MPRYKDTPKKRRPVKTNWRGEPDPHDGMTLSAAAARYTDIRRAAWSPVSHVKLIRHTPYSYISEDDVVVCKFMPSYDDLTARDWVPTNPRERPRNH